MKSFIDHKFVVGQKVFYLNKQCKCASFTVKQISINMYEDHNTVWYYGEDMYESHREDTLFATEADVKDWVFNGTLDVK